MVTLRPNIGYFDSRYVNVSGDTMTGNLAISVLTASELVATDASKNLVSLAVATYPSLTELSYVKGVSSAIQTQINTKAPSTAPTFATSITGSYLTASEILGTDASKNIVSLPVATYPSLAELAYVKGVTSAIQTQFTGKAATDQTMYIGTTAHALNRASAAEGLAGITSLTPGADFTLSQNSVNVLTSVNTGAIVNTLYLKTGNVGIGTTTFGTGATTNLALGGGTTTPVIGAATADIVHLAAVDKAAADRRLYIQSEAGSVISLGNDRLNFAATTGIISIAGTDEISLTATDFSPSTSDGNALGTTSLMWSDLFLAAGGVLNFGNGASTFTEVSSTMKYQGGRFRIHANAGVSPPGFDLTDDDMAHGMTGYLPTNAYLYFDQLSSFGGVLFYGATSGDRTALSFNGLIGTTDPTDTKPAVLFSGAKKAASGNGVQDMGALETVAQWMNNATPVMTILGSGNTGIGDIAPGELLDVAGNIDLTGVLKVDDVQVVGNRVVDARADDTIAGAGAYDDATAGVIDALRDAMISHGLLAAA